MRVIDETDFSSPLVNLISAPHMTEPRATQYHTSQECFANSNIVPEGQLPLKQLVSKY